MIPLPADKRAPASQTDMRTCSSLTEAHSRINRVDNFKSNFVTLSDAKLSQALAESLLRIDHATQSTLLMLPPDVKLMKVSEFVSRHASGTLSLCDHIFSNQKLAIRPDPPVNRTSGEDLRRQVRQQLADAKAPLKMELPPTRSFMEKQPEDRTKIISVLKAVVTTYNSAHAEVENLLI